MDVESLAKELILKNMTSEQQMAVLNSVRQSVVQAKEVQKRKIGENVDLVVQALKKIDSDLRSRFEDVGNAIEKRVASIKDGRDGINGKNGRDGKDGKSGKDGATGPAGRDGVPGRDGVDGDNGTGVASARIDFDGSLVIVLDNGREINVGEVVPFDVAERIKVISNGGGTSQYVLDTLASLQAQISAISGGLSYQGTWNASTNTPTLTSSSGTSNYYYVVSVSGSTNLNGITDWVAGDWAIYNGTVWQKIDQTNLVISVAGRTGAITLTTADIGGLGTIATQAANNVSITGGSITGITALTATGNAIISDNSANAALRITQTGAGNALLVEDSTNPDSTPFVVDASGGVVIGNTSALTVTDFVGTSRVPRFQQTGTGGSVSQAYISSWSTSNTSTAGIIFGKSNSGTVGTAGVVESGTDLGFIQFSGDDGTNMIRAALILAEVDGTPGTNDMPGRLVFSTTADGASTPTERIRITSAGKTGFATAAPASTVHVAGDTILSNVNVIGASYDSVSFSVAAEETNPQDLFFSPDGLKMYIIGTSGDDVNEYNLSTAWVVSSAVFVTSFSVLAQDQTSQGLFLRADGIKMYVVGSTNDTVFQYTLSTPWSVATASYDSISFSVATQDISPTGISFKPNGLSMYMVGQTGDAVYQYTLSTAWNVSTATFLQSFSVSGQETVPIGLSFTGDGSRMFVIGSTGDDVNQYNLTTPWDISTSAFVNVFSVSGQDTFPTGIYIKPDGTKMYIMGSTNDTVYQYTVPSINIQLTGQTSVAALDVQQDLTVYGNLQAYKISASSSVLVTSPAGLGYGTGSGGTVTQATSRTTGVTLSKPTGAITMFSAAGSAIAATFTVTNTLVAATDTIILNQKSGTNLYVLLVTAVAAGSFNVTFYTTGGVATDAPVINFSLIKGVTA